MYELSRKTNQFICSLKRPKESEFCELIEDKYSHAISVSLKDKLSDSGIIAVILAKKNNSIVEIQELCISCRALGRKLEDLIIFPAIKNIPFFRNIESINFEIWSFNMILIPNRRLCKTNVWVVCKNYFSIFCFFGTNYPRVTSN